MTLNGADPFSISTSTMNKAHLQGFLGTISSNYVRSGHVVLFHIHPCNSAKSSHKVDITGLSTHKSPSILEHSITAKMQIHIPQKPNLVTKY